MADEVVKDNVVPFTRLTNINQLDDVDDIKYDTIEIPEWKMIVEFGSIDADSMLEIIAADSDPVLKRRASLQLIALSVIKGAVGKERLSPDEQQEWIKKLGKRNTKVINTLVEKLFALNDIKIEKKGEETKGVEGAKNSSGEVVASASPIA